MPFDANASFRQPALTELRAVHARVLSIREQASVSEEVDHILRRIETVTSFVGDRVAKIPAALLSRVYIGSLRRRVEKLLTALESYSSTRATSTIEAANEAADGLLSDLPALAADIADTDELDRRLRHATAQFQAVREAIEKTRKQVPELRKTAEDYQGRIDKLSSDIDIIVSNFRSQYGEFQSLLRKEFDESQRAIRADIDEAISALRATAEGMKTAFNENQRLMRLEFDTAVKNQKDELAASTTGMTELGDTLVKSLEGYKTDAERIMEAIGNTGLTGNYQKIARSEKKVADFMRWGSLLLMLIGLGVVGWALYQHEVAPNLEGAILRIAFGLAFSAPAAYLSFESAKHRRNEMRAQKAELELAALGPFLSKMPDEKQLAIREKLVEKFFGQPLVDGKVDMPPGLLTVVNKLIDKLPKVEQGKLGGE